MSTRASVAAVTTALKNWLQSAVAGKFGAGVDVTTVRPDRIVNDGSKINLYLFQVTPNHGYRNADMPVRRSDGSIGVKPRTAIDLHYLVSFSTKDDDVFPQVLLAQTMQVLGSNPGIARDRFASLLSTASAEIKAAPIADQPELIKITHQAVTLEEMSRIWGLFPETKYILSTVYAVTTVILEAEIEPEAALPVQAPSVGVGPFLVPELASAAVGGADAAPVLRLSGERLSGDTVAEIDGLGPFACTVAGNDLECPIPAAVGPGLHGVRVLKPVEVLGKTFQVDSNAVGFLLRPVIKTAAKAAGKVNLTLERGAKKGQTATLILHRTAGAGDPIVKVSNPPLGADSASLSFTVPGALAGTFFVRVRVADADSLVKVVGGKPTPEVTLP